MFGYEPDEALGKEMISVTFAPEVLEFVKKQVATDSLEPYESIGVRKDGTRFPMEICARKMEYKGRIVRFGAIRDLTERKRVEEELRESEANYRQLYNSSPAGIYRIDFKNGKFLKANDVFCEYLGCRQEEIISLNPHDILTEESNKLFLERVGKMALGIEVPMAVEYEISNKKGKQLCLQLNNKYIYDTEGYVVAADVVAHDITERKLVEDVLKESEQKYRELSIIDDLTQLYNSRHFHAQIGIEIERSNRRYYEQPLTLLLLDIDNFKRFNDTYGHVEGDYVLSQLGQVIKRCLRKTDSAYRYGGEEFTIMLPMTTIEEGIVTAKRIQTEIRKEAFSPVLGQEVYMTVSIGLAQYKQKEEMKAFVQRIDKLMYQAKKEGRNRICHDRIRNKHSVIGSN
jgi:diguanylate cyclase (GGDEF)-like protein/PAS domain S-box-containing protein